MAKLKCPPGSKAVIRKGRASFCVVKDSGMAPFVVAGLGALAGVILWELLTPDPNTAVAWSGPFDVNADEVSAALVRAGFTVNNGRLTQAVSGPPDNQVMTLLVKPSELPEATAAVAQVLGR